MELRMPLVIDFGSTNTTAGVYLDSLYFEETKGAPFADGFQPCRSDIRITLTASYQGVRYAQKEARFIYCRE